MNNEKLKEYMKMSREQLLEELRRMNNNVVWSAAIGILFVWTIIIPLGALLIFAYSIAERRTVEQVLYSKK